VPLLRGDFYRLVNVAIYENASLPKACTTMGFSPFLFLGRPLCPHTAIYIYVLVLLCICVKSLLASPALLALLYLWPHAPIHVC
jgi:hypothetical protein